MQPIGNPNVSISGVSFDTPGQKVDKPVEQRIREIESRITAIDISLNKNKKVMDDFAIVRRAGLIKLEEHNLDWQKCRFMGVITGIGACLTGLGLPAVISAVAFVGFAAKGIHSFVQAQKLKSKLTDMQDQVMLSSGYNSVDDAFARAERDQLKTELNQARKEKTSKDKEQIKEMASSLKKDESTSEEKPKEKKIEDMGDAINIGGVKSEKNSFFGFPGDLIS